MKKILPAASVIAAGVLWGIISFFISALSDAGMSAMQITFVRMAVAAPVMLTAAVITCRRWLKLQLKDIWMFAGTGIVSIVLFNICYFYTMIHSEASIAVVLLYTSPVFIMLISAVFFKEKVTLSKLVALGMTFGGCVLVAGLSGGSGVTPFIVMTGLASGLFYGLYTIFGRIALQKYNSLTVTVYTFVFGLIGSAPVGDVAGTFRIISEQPSLIFWCAGIGIICTILPYFLYTWGLARMESARAAITVAVEPLVGAVIGMTFYHENSSPARLIGIALILSALVVLNVKKPSEKEV